MKICSFEGCELKHYAKGFCRAHHRQNKKGNELTIIEVHLPQKGTCVGPECERAAKKKGLCETHYTQQRRGKELTVIGTTHRTGKILGDICGSEGCNNLRLKSIGEYYHSRCSQCFQLRRRYKMSTEDAQLMWEAQGCMCVCCSKPGPAVYTRGHSWHIDHDHSCCPGEQTCGQCVRGIVCQPCNTNLLNENMTKELWEAIGSYLGYA